tara:strand:+ start:624 stop:911 length:288 start_codon:yes stop_codon:yes gene_type:complete
MSSPDMFKDPCTIALESDKQLMAIHNNDLEGLVENYVHHIIDGLDIQSMEQICYDLLSREYEKMSWDEVTEEIVDLYDEDTLIDLLPEASDNQSA